MPSAAALLALAGQAARQVPGVSLTERELQRVEAAVLRQLKDRMDAIGDPDGAIGAATVGDTGDASPGQLLAGLLSDSVEQTAPQARLRLHGWLLRQLLPDQARILAALSDGAVYPLVHVALKGPLGAPAGGGDPLLENASTVGRAAGVALPDRVPLYLTHLRALGLVEAGPEDEALRDGYDIAETDATVRSAVERAGGRPVRTIRRTVRLSTLGHDLWAACQTETGDER